MKNSASNILAFGLIFALILIIFQNPSVQKSLVYYLGLEQNLVEIKKDTNVAGKIETSVVSRVVDGDTVVLEDGRTIRYLNVDTPETKKPNTVKQCFGPEATAFNKMMVEGKKVSLKADKQDKDRYQRDLRFVFLEGRDTNKIENSVNALMVSEGYGRSLIIKPNNTYEKIFNSLEFESKNKNNGLWAVCNKPFVE